MQFFKQCSQACVSSNATTYITYYSFQRPKGHQRDQRSWNRGPMEGIIIKYYDIFLFT